MSFLPIPNEFVLLFSGVALIILLTWEYFDTQVLLAFGNGKQENRIPKRSTVKFAEESQAEEVPPPAPISRVSSRSPSPVAEGAEESDAGLVSASGPVEEEDDVGQVVESSRQSVSRYQERISVCDSITNLALTNLTKEDVEEIVAKIMNPLPPGCEPFGPNADYMAEKMPHLSRPDIVRFLVARKGNVTLATEMAEKCTEWRASVFPLKKEDLRAAITTGCFFPYKTARDGTPCVYMRGGLYDNVKATPEQFVLAAAYAIEYSLRMHPDQINVTVVVDTVIIPGAPNLGADMTFIKLFVKALSDNYPERLKRIVMYPFPWYGRAIWSVVKVFIDKRTQDKALLIGDTGKREIPAELAKFVDPENIPICCAGKCKDPILDLMTTLK